MLALLVAGPGLALRGGAPPLRSPLPCRRPAALRMMTEVECDVVIVGGGPAGMTCALYTARADHKTVVLDKNPAVGALAITSHIANYPGVDKSMTGAELLDQMRNQACEYGTDYRRAQVFGIDALDSGEKYVYTPDATYKARALVLATGAMGRPPSYKGEDTFLGKGVSYCATCDGALYRDREVVVAGLNQEAVEEAQFLTKFASTVHWITNKDVDEHARSREHAQDASGSTPLAEPNVKHWSHTRLMSIDGDASGVTGCHVQQRGDDTPQELPVDGVFIYVAGSLATHRKPRSLHASPPATSPPPSEAPSECMQLITDFIEEKVDYQDDGGVAVDDKMMTSVDGIYAIGDIRNTPFKQARSSLPHIPPTTRLPPTTASRAASPLAPPPTPVSDASQPPRVRCRSSGGGRRRRRLHSRDGHRPLPQEPQEGARGLDPRMRANHLMIYADRLPPGRTLT